MNPLPLFPLRTVLFPGGLLPLRIFEPRYVDMVGRCLRAESEFGVVQILGGAETGAIDELATIGTSARIVDFNTADDGLLGLLCRGERRFRIEQRSLQPDGLHLAEVTWLTEGTTVPLTAAQRPLVAVLQRVLEELGTTAQFLQPRFDEAGWVSNRFAELLPLDRAAQQRLLETDDAAARLEILAPLVRTD
jgi:uncharacterized protein